MRADIYFLQFLKDDAVSVGGGGIGTLISYLCPLLEGMGFSTTVYQCAGRRFDAMFGATKVVGIPGYPGPGRSNEAVAGHLRDVARREAGTDDRLEIFAADFFSVANKNPLAITVQNGLAWDAAIEHLTSSKLYQNAWGEKLFRYRCQMRGLRRFEACYNRVAVDLYFINWYRSFRGARLDGRVWYNPNPAPAAAWDARREAESAQGGPLRIIFARRFVPEKGTRVIAEVLGDLLRSRPQIEITLAGEGPEQEFLARTFSGDARVTMTSYRTEDALQVHARHDIAVIPSLCGEATCLAVLEAMAAGCAVVATNMGGTITEIIDGFNGRLCWPNKKSLLEALIDVIDSRERRLRFQKCGWDTSQQGFGMAGWRKRWTDIFNQIVNGKEEAARAMARPGLR